MDGVLDTLTDHAHRAEMGAFGRPTSRMNRPSASSATETVRDPNRCIVDTWDTFCALRFDGTPDWGMIALSEVSHDRSRS